MVQDDIRTNLTPWRPTPTLISPEWQTYLEGLSGKAKGSAGYIAGMHYDRQETTQLLREWGLPWIVVVAGALLLYEEKELSNIPVEDRRQFLVHIQQAQYYIDCIEDEDLSTLLSPPYKDLGARLIAVATYYVALQGLSQRKNKRPFNQHELSRIEAIGATLLHITKQINLWLFKRTIEDLILKLCYPAQYRSLKEEIQNILQQDEEKLKDFCQAATVFCQEMTHLPVSITYTACGVEGFLRRKQMKQTTAIAQEVPLTGFDLVIFDVIVSTIQDCYTVFGLISLLGFQDDITNRIASPKLNGSSYLSLSLIIKKEQPLQHLSWLKPDLYTCQIQIATPIMHAVTNYGCLYPACYQLYTDTSLQETKEKETYQKMWSNEEGKIYTSIIESFKRGQKQEDAAAPIIVYDKRLRPFSFPKGATVLDFGYAYNENLIGYVYGFINDREVPLYRKLNAGDIVDIKTSNAPQTHAYWVERKYVTTSRALNAIQKQRFYENKAYKLLCQKLEYYRYKLTEDELSQELYDFVRKNHLGTVNTYLERFDESADLRYTPDWAAEQIMQQIRERNEQVIAAKPKWVVRLDPQSAEKHIYYLPKSFCNVCQPTYPRDSNIVGYVSQKEKMLVIHSAHCPRLMDRHHRQRVPLYPLTWHQLPTFRVGFSATAQDRRGLILDISKQLRHHQCSLVSLHAEAIHKDAQLRFIIETYDVGEVLDLLQKIKKVESIIAIDIDPLKTAPHVYAQLREQPLLITEKIEAERALEETQIVPVSRRPMLRNPFNISRPPGEKMFFGRTPEIKKLQRELCADARGKAIFLYGPRRSGKSSLCSHFLEHYVYPPYWYVYHSLQSATKQSETTILMQIAEEVCWIFQEHFNRRPVSWQEVLVDDPQVRFKRVLQGCLLAIPGSSLILVLDEFGGAIEAYQKKFLDERFFTYWRNLMNDIPQLSLIFVLPTIPHNFLTSGQLSSAFSFTEAHSMEFLDEESAYQLLVNPLQEQNIVMHPGTIKRILDLTGCNPYYLTLIGSQLVAQLNLDPYKCLLNDKDLDIAVDRLVKGNTKQNFYFYHDELHAEELPIVKAIVDITQQSGQPAASLKKIAARLRKPIDALRPHLKRLQEGLILREQGAQWSSSQPYYAFTIELVRLWMVHNNDFFLPSDIIEGAE